MVRRSTKICFRGLPWLLPLLAFADCGGSTGFYTKPDVGNPAMQGSLASASGSQLQCVTDSLVVGSGQSVNLKFATADGSPATGSFQFSTSPASIGTLAGSQSDPLSVTFTAPVAGDQPVPVSVLAHLQGSTDVSGACHVVLQPGTSFVTDNGTLQGAVGNVYLTDQLPDQYKDNGKVYALPPIAALQALKAVQQIVVGNFDFPQRDFTNPFPGLKNVDSWYAITFQATLKTPAPGNFQVKVCSDDASQTYYNGTLLIDLNDHHYADHPCGESKPVSLSADVSLTLLYLQDKGPGFRLQMWDRQVDATGAPMGDYVVIPPDRFSRPK